MVLNVSCQARFAEQGWLVKLHGSDQPYYLRKTIVVSLPDNGINEGKHYQATLEENNGGWIGIGYHGRAQFIRTIGPKEFISVELGLEEAESLIARMKADG